jgi:DNA-binding beta-propeller fold protein YncE
MTASPTVQPAPGAVPVPEAGELPPTAGTPNAEEAPPERRRRKVLLLLLLLGAFVALLGLAIWYLLFRQPIMVPTIPGETIMPGYVTSVYGAGRPMGVAVSPDGGRIYAGETSGDMVARVFDAQGSLVGHLVPPTSTGSQHVPVYLAVHPGTGEVWVSDRPSASVYVYAADGTYLRAFAPEAAAGWQPLGIAFDAAGNAYVTDVGRQPHRVHVFDAEGTELRTIGADEGLEFPNGIAVDDAGYVYVTDSNNGRLLVFDADGAVVARVAQGSGTGQLGLPRGVAIDGLGRVYVADSSGHQVSVFGRYQPGSERLEPLGVFGAMGVSDGAFSYPNAVAVDGRGRLYVADSGNDRVQLWSY